MDIIIGESPRIGPSDQYKRDGDGPVSVEARFLEISEKREKGGSDKTLRGRILSVLIPEGQKVPQDLESGDYRIYLRFVHRPQARF
ncbi:MAG: hypothetical protein P4L43_12670 [Syntrophobacteraceae bacterium]|nr:hypothetical protein [Syntrophobacteraceae bacterium]